MANEQQMHQVSCEQTHRVSREHDMTRMQVCVWEGIRVINRRFCAQHTHDEYTWCVDVAVHVVPSVLLCGGIYQRAATHDSDATMLVCHAWSGGAC